MSCWRANAYRSFISALEDRCIPLTEAIERYYHIHAHATPTAVHHGVPERAYSEVSSNHYLALEVRMSSQWEECVLGLSRTALLLPLAVGHAHDRQMKWHDKQEKTKPEALCRLSRGQVRAWGAPATPYSATPCCSLRKCPGQAGPCKKRTRPMTPITFRH